VRDFRSGETDGIFRKFPYLLLMGTAEVLKLPLSEKLRIMEAIWDELRERADQIDIPQEQKRLLDARRAKVRNGKSQVLDWDTVKGTIGGRA